MKISIIRSSITGGFSQRIKSIPLCNRGFIPIFFDQSPVTGKGISNPSAKDDRISDYIIKNPENWKKDDFFDCQ